MDWVVYILECADGTLYTGITNDFAKRLAAHHDGTAAKYTRGRGPFKTLLREKHKDRSSASKREMKIKAMSRAQKLQLTKKHAKKRL